jgi:hypothetical protein
MCLHLCMNPRASKESMCCICFEEENTLAMICCQYCNEGTTCIDCFEDLDISSVKEIVCCPICRNELFNKYKVDIIKRALFFSDGIKGNTILILRWFHNYYETLT